MESGPNEGAQPPDKWPGTGGRGVMRETPILRPLQRWETGLQLIHSASGSELLHPRRCGPREQVTGVQGGRE